MGGREPKSENEIKFPTATVASRPQWIELPRDVTANILQRLGAVEILQSAQKVCTTWWRVCQDPAMWRVIHITLKPYHPNDQISAMCRRVVDLSQGQLLDLTIENLGDDKLLNYMVDWYTFLDPASQHIFDQGIENFGNVELLNYIADRSSHLKCLTLRNCIDISGEDLAEAVKKLAHLEELHLIVMPDVQAEDILNIGNSCPLLKSFSYGSKQQDTDYGNVLAQAVAKSMPNLRHLCLVGNWMENKGLEAILDGCPHLESLDLRQCFGLDLQRGALHKRCSEQIKHVKYPCDSISDIKWDVVDHFSTSGDYLCDWLFLC